MAGNVGAGRHRLGTPGLVHCLMHPQVAAVLVAQSWWRRSAGAAARIRSRHSLAGLRRGAVVVAMERAWVPSADVEIALGNAA